MDMRSKHAHAHARHTIIMTTVGCGDKILVVVEGREAAGKDAASSALSNT